jgi:RNA polymerase sigma factor (sigma-70 family)
MAGDNELLFDSCKKLVPFIVFQHVGDYGELDFDDLIQQGNMAIMVAIGSYKPTHGTTISTWAFRYIKSAVIREAIKQRARRSTEVSLSYFADDDSGGDEMSITELASETMGLFSDNGDWQQQTDNEIDCARILSKLTRKERFLVEAHLAGMSQTAIGGQVGLSQEVVSKHTKKIFTKLRDICA